MRCSPQVVTDRGTVQVRRLNDSDDYIEFRVEFP
jgi:hypothetical protein